MPSIIPTVGETKSFTEDATSLNGKEDLLLQLNTDGTVKLNAGADPLGVMVCKLQNGQPEVSVRLLGAGGTYRVIQSAAIAIGAKVMVDTAAKTKVKTLTTAGLPVRSLGIKIADSSTTAGGAAGDVIEVLDLQELVTALDAAVALSLTETALTNSSGGTPGATLAAQAASVTGVDGTGSNAASKADVDAQLVIIRNSIASLATKLEAGRVDTAAIKAVLDTAGLTS